MLKVHFHCYHLGEEIVHPVANTVKEWLLALPYSKQITGLIPWRLMNFLYGLCIGFLRL